ncbi:hypothetical protein B0F90DRAFT_1922403 [Multifurca ochricompacta]|uniref:HIT domain-containing protein n=1 Tax=Multifurca ochricompacta TaxID=376703 RepID=A0AAD4MCT3_9AGAM|nr:hypothetical protein B0F90DRAFT_1922403 [Multifurca ochricompacta]
MSFAPKPGCPMCGIVSQARRQHNAFSVPFSPSSSSTSQPDVLWRDDNFTVYREKTNPVSSKGHIIIAFNLHVPSIYMLSSSDLPLLAFIRDIATKLLTSLLPPESPLLSPTSAATLTSVSAPSLTHSSNFRIGFITPPFRDSRIPVTDHLHAHAFIAPADQLGWFRSVAYSAIAWYDIDDLIAEIRESVSNNRVKSGYANRQNAPINLVPDAGSRAGTANGRETTESSLASTDIEEGQRSPVGSPPMNLLLPPPGRSLV